jgi:hypothetical protein
MKHLVHAISNSRASDWQGIAETATMTVGLVAEGDMTFTSRLAFSLL